MHIDLLESNVKVQRLFIRRPDKTFTTLEEKKKTLITQKEHLTGGIC